MNFNQLSQMNQGQNKIYSRPAPKFQEQISIERLIPISNKGNLRAFVTVRLRDGTIIRGCRVIKEKDKKAWVSLPVVESPDSAEPFWTAIALPKAIKAALDEAVIEAARLQGILK